MTTPFVLNEAERVMYSGSKDPGELYRRMLPTADDEISDNDLLQALRALDPDTLAQALLDFDDDEVRYLSDLMENADD